MNISSSEAAAPVQSPARKDVEKPDSPHAGLSTLVRPLFFFLVIPALLFFLFYSANVDGRLDLFHEGEALVPAFEVAHGKLPFRDVYLQHGWGVNLLRPKLAFLLFGQSVASNRRLFYGPSGLLVPLPWIGMYLFLYSLFRRKFWIAPALLLLALADVLVRHRHLFPFLSLAMLMWGIRRTPGFLYIAGALASAAVFYSLDTGIYVFAIAAVFLAVYAFGNPSVSSDFKGWVLRYAIGTAAGALPFVVYLLWHGILGDFIRNSFLQIRYQKMTWGIPPPSPALLFGPFKTSTERTMAIYIVLKWYFPVLMYLFTGLVLLPGLIARKFSQEDAPMLLVLVAGIVFFASALGRSDEAHLMYALAPFWILCICHLERSLRLLKNDEKTPFMHRRSFSYLTLAAVFLGSIFYFWATSRNGGILQEKWRLRQWKRSGMPGYVTLQVEDAGGVKVPVEQAEEIQETVEFLKSHTAPDQPVFDFSNQGAYYFLASRSNSTSFCQAAYAVPPPLQAKALEQLQQNPPAAVIFREDAAYNPQKREPLIDEWVRQRYSEAVRIGKNSIFLPSPR